MTRRPRTPRRYVTHEELDDRLANQLVDGGTWDNDTGTATPAANPQAESEGSTAPDLGGRPPRDWSRSDAVMDLFIAKMPGKLGNEKIELLREWIGDETGSPPHTRTLQKRFRERERNAPPARPAKPKGK